MCVCVGCECMRRSKDNLRSQFSPSTLIWIPGIIPVTKMCFFIFENSLKITNSWKSCKYPFPLKAGISFCPSLLISSSGWVTHKQWHASVRYSAHKLPDLTVTPLCCVTLTSSSFCVFYLKMTCVRILCWVASFYFRLQHFLSPSLTFLKITGHLLCWMTFM